MNELFRAWTCEFKKANPKRRSMNIEAVKDYYDKTLRGSDDLKTKACSTPHNMPERVKALLANIHDEVLAKYYGCGLRRSRDARWPARFGSRLWLRPRCLYAVPARWRLRRSRWRRHDARAVGDRARISVGTRTGSAMMATTFASYRGISKNSTRSAWSRRASTSSFRIASSIFRSTNRRCSRASSTC